MKLIIKSFWNLKKPLKKLIKLIKNLNLEYDKEKFSNLILENFYVGILVHVHITLIGHDQFFRLLKKKELDKVI